MYSLNRHACGDAVNATSVKPLLMFYKFQVYYPPMNDEKNHIAHKNNLFIIAMKFNI